MVVVSTERGQRTYVMLFHLLAEHTLNHPSSRHTPKRSVRPTLDCLECLPVPPENMPIYFKFVPYTLSLPHNLVSLANSEDVDEHWSRNGNSPTTFMR